MSPTIGVLAVQGDVEEHLHHVTACGAQAIAVRRESEITSVDGLIIPGGESTAMSRLLSVYDLVDPLTELASAGLPMFGSCAGMILLASHVVNTREDAVNIGAVDMTVRRNAFGRQVDSFEQDLQVTGLEDPYRAVFIRAPWIEATGPSVDVLASVTASDGSTHPVAVRDGNSFATSFHPEVTSDYRIHQLFVDTVAKAA